MNTRKHALCFNFSLSCCFLFCFSLSDAFSQPLGPINTERPSFSSSPLALATGYWQIETGYQFTRNKDDPSLKDHTLPNVLLRYGFHENFELQLSSAGYSWQDSDHQKTQGFQDASLGIKWQINDSDAVIPIGLFGGISLPMGSSDFTSDDYAPSAGLFWTHSSTLEWFGTAKLNYSDDSFIFNNAVGISFSLPSDTGAYIEYLGTFYEDGNEGSEHNLNLGITWLASYDLQLDINGGFGFNSSANDYYTGMGISYRFQ